MGILKILVGGMTGDMQKEREAMARAVQSLRISSMQAEVKFSDETWPREWILSNIAECQIYLALYNRTHYGPLLTAEDLSAAELEFEEAQRLKKPTLIFIKQLGEYEREHAQQALLLRRVEEYESGKYRNPEFATPEHLEEQAVDGLMTLLKSFGLSVRRPPFQAPRAGDFFVGRRGEMEAALAALKRGGRVLIYGANGIGGAGTTELATHLAHHLQEVYEEGILWADVPSSRPMDTISAWARLYGGLEALGRGDLRFDFRPLKPEERRAEEMAVRSDELTRVLEGKRVLAVLDGVASARDEEKLAVLLKALGHCPVVVTSRMPRPQSLERATSVPLGPLNPEETWEWFVRRVGARRLAGQREQVDQIGRLVDGAPLAVELVTAELREDKELTPDRLREQIESEWERVAVSRHAQPEGRGLYAGIRQSYGHLSTQNQEFFRMLGVFGGNDFDRDAAASVALAIPHEANCALDDLRRFSFVQERRRPGRFYLQPVLSGFALEQLTDLNAELRMAKHYGLLAKEYGRKLQTAECHAAHQVLNAELSNILAGQEIASRRDSPEGWELCRDYIHGAMTYYFNLHSMWSDWMAWSTAGIEACRKLGDTRSGVAIASGLGMVHYRKGEWDQALEFFQNALAALEQVDDTAGMANIYTYMGNVYVQKGEWTNSASAHQKSLRLYEQLGDIRGQAQTRANLGLLYAKHGNRNKARALLTQSLEGLQHLNAQNEADIVRKWLRNLPAETR